MADKSFHCGKEGKKVQLVARRREETFQCVVVAKQSPPHPYNSQWEKHCAWKKMGGGEELYASLILHICKWPKDGQSHNIMQHTKHQLIDASTQCQLCNHIISAIVELHQKQCAFHASDDAIWNLYILFLPQCQASQLLWCFTTLMHRVTNKAWANWRRNPQFTTIFHCSFYYCHQLLGKTTMSLRVSAAPIFSFKLYTFWWDYSSSLMFKG